MIDAFFPNFSFKRFFAIIPIACLFLVLPPLTLTSLNLGGTSCFFIGWLATFKLVLFALGNGPLNSSPPLNLTHFVLLACFPVKFLTCSHKKSSFSIERRQLATIITSDSVWHNHWSAKVSHLTKLFLLGFFVCVYKYKGCLHPKIVFLLYTLHIYFMLELWLVLISAIVQFVFRMRLELEQPFNDPHLATSLQDFWGKRWNLIVTNTLRPTVYDPVLSMLVRYMQPRLARCLAVMATFLVSGVMHELVFYTIGRAKPTGEVLSFFILNGACLILEIGIKRSINRKYWLPQIVSRLLALTFVILTCFWLFLPPFLRNKADVKGCTEAMAFLEFVKHGRLVSPNFITCPLYA
ncbi:hypothetical protein DM860_003056 [Cuscuta australis]|uniref:Wax synthase domain-containing protein n=1 Tax=Cuscuta australis TaxID=267555 RepID=A0A328D6H7_9ASTE|nr:hypothetical protein DM860_003056 [Cuscuta australis]